MKHYSPELVFLQSENARAKLKDLSGILKKSPQRLKYSIKILEKEKVIHSPFTVFDYSYFGLILFRVYFRGGFISDADKATIVEKLSDNPYVVSIYELSGGYDLAIELQTKNPSRFNKELKNVADLIPTLNSYKVLLNIVTHIYPRKYLSFGVDEQNYPQNEMVVGGDRELQSFSYEEMRVMRSLYRNPRKRLTRLAREAGMNVRTAEKIMDSLKERKVIRGYKEVVEISKLGASRTRLMLKLHNVTNERDSQLRAYLRQTKEIILANKTVGDWDMEIDIEAFDTTKSRQIISEIRSEFKDLIESFNMIEFIKFHKKSYLPSYLFDNPQMAISAEAAVGKSGNDIDSNAMARAVKGKSAQESQDENMDVNQSDDQWEEKDDTKENDKNYKNNMKKTKKKDPGFSITIVGDA